MIPRLSPDAVRDAPSPNYGARPVVVPIDMLILHATGTDDAASALARLRDPRSGVSAHYLVAEDGMIWRLVDEHASACHVGVGVWRGHDRLNDRSIGIELVNPGHEHGTRHFPALQMAAVCELCLSVLSRHTIPARNVVGHGDVAPESKRDPGELFDWRGLARNGVGLWPDVPDAGDDEIDAKPLRADLVAIGYDLGPGGASLTDVLRAAQRHWRPELVSGLADAGTRARLAALRAMVDAGY